jgi:hypothetical protein
MKKTISFLFALVAIITSSNLFSQDLVSMKWTQNENEKLFYECQDYLTASGKAIKEETAQKISVCYKDEVEKNYKREAYAKLSDDEKNTIKETTIAACAQKFGVKLTAKTADKTPPKK